MAKENIIFGIRPVIEAIKAGKEIEKILVQTSLRSENSWELRKLTTEIGIPVQYVPLEKLNRVTMKNHQGVIAYISPVTYQPLENIVPALFEDGKTPLLLILDRITDVRNIGAIARTAECVGVHAIIVPSKGSGLINEDTVKTSAGAIYKIPVCREDNLKDSIDFLRSSGLQIVSCTEKAEKPFYEGDFHGPVAIIMGSEDDGISEEYLKRSDLLVRIPLLGETESLNVSVAAGILLYEVVKQRM